MLEPLKPFYNVVLRPVALFAGRCHIHPNVLTLVGTLLFGFAGYLSAIDLWRPAIWVVAVGSLFDGLDGIVARECNKKTVFGAIFDSVCDRITEIVLLFGILVAYMHDVRFLPYGAYAAFSAITGSLMVSYVRARSEGAGINFTGGFFQRPERLIFLCACLLGGKTVMMWGLLGLTILSCFTVAERLWAAYKICKNKPT